MMKQNNIRVILLLVMGVLLGGCAAERQQASSTTTSVRATPTVAASAPAASAASDAPAVTVTTTAGDALPTYYWPASLPAQLKVDSGASEVGETGYFLQTTLAGDRRIIVAAGTAIEQHNVLEPSDVLSKMVSVRGHQGRVLSNGKGFNVFWEEAGTQYAVLGTGVNLDELLRVAEALERVDVDQLRQRIQQTS
jgi:hypothetical protein